MNKLELMKKIASLQHETQADKSISEEKRLWYGFAIQDVLTKCFDFNNKDWEVEEYEK
jgi:hypothetical protein